MISNLVDDLEIFVKVIRTSVFSHQTAKDSSVEKLLLKLNTWYLEKEGEKV